MRAVDFIVRYIEDQSMTQTEAAEVVGWSRQNFWDKLNNRNPRYRTMRRILTAFGFEWKIVRDDDKAVEFDEKDFWRVADEKNICINTLEDFVNAMGYRFEIVKMQDGKAL